MSKLEGTNLIYVKQRNDSSIKEVIYKYGPISRSKIAEMLSLTPPTITSNIAALMAHGIVEELPEKDGHTNTVQGRKPVNIDFIKTSYYFIGIDMIPDKTVICITDLSADIIAYKIDLETNHEYEKFISYISGVVLELVKQTGIDKNKIAGIGVGVPGFVESIKGIVRYNNRYNWENKMLAHDLEVKTGMHVVIDNNARARIIGEDLLYKKIRPESFAYYFISKGIACPLMIRNKMVSGQTSGAGEIGHMVMKIGGEKCDTCGNFGCLEAYASENALINQCKKIMIERKDTILNILEPNPEKLTLDHILIAETNNDVAVLDIVQTAICYLAVALANIINFVSPKLVIVDSYIMKQGINRDYFMKILKQNLYGLNDGEVEIEFKDFDPLCGAKGAVALAIKNFFIK